MLRHPVQLLSLQYLELLHSQHICSTYCTLTARYTAAVLHRRTAVFTHDQCSHQQLTTSSLLLLKLYVNVGKIHVLNG
jgi:hypothetical protein